VQLQRLRHAWQHADVRIHTDPLTPEDLLATALAELHRLLPAQG
jgi:hypothetical protein